MAEATSPATNRTAETSPLNVAMRHVVLVWCAMRRDTQIDWRLALMLCMITAMGPVPLLCLRAVIHDLGQ